MQPTEQIDAFLHHVKTLTQRDFTERRSSLRGLLTYLRNPSNHNKKFTNLQDVKNKCANPTDPRIAKYTSALHSLSLVWGTTLDYVAITNAPNAQPARIAPPATSTDIKTIRAFVVSKQKELEKCRDYACNDVGAFPQCINPSLPSSERTRIRGARPGKVGTPFDESDIGWRYGGLAQAYSAVERAQAGECTNYAYYAAHILGQRKGQHPRLEIVSWEGKDRFKHVFVMVGRKGETLEGHKVPPVKQWNDDLVIVDCWALTLGYGCIFTKDDYCFKNTMMYPLKVIMDSLVEEKLVIDSQARLKPTGVRAQLVNGSGPTIGGPPPGRPPVGGPRPPPGRPHGGGSPPGRPQRDVA